MALLPKSFAWARAAQPQQPLTAGVWHGDFNWGLVAGKTHTFLPWDSWQRPYTDGQEPAIWFHEVFLAGGKP